jgi:D-proline reductase (dithiol) PrdB
VQRSIEEAGIPTIIISALPPVTRQNGSPRAVAPIVPMGANAGAPNDIDMQMGILRETLSQLLKIKQVGDTVPLAFEYHAKI